MSDNCLETDTMMQPYVIPAETTEWSNMIQWLDESMEDIRREMTDDMFEIAISPDRDERPSKFQARLDWFEKDFQAIASTWTSHERINFYVYFDAMRHMVEPVMEPWEKDFALICK